LRLHRLCQTTRQYAALLLCFCAFCSVPEGYGKPNRVSQLIMELADPRSHVRQKAVEGLVKIGEPAVEPLIVALKGASSGSEVLREEAADILGTIKDPRGVEPLVAVLLTVGYTALQDHAEDALVKIGTPVVGPLMSVVLSGVDDGREAHECAVFLVSFFHVQCVQSKAAETLGRIGAPAVEPLMAAMRDPRDPQVRACAALGHYRAPRAGGATHPPGTLIYISGPRGPHTLKVGPGTVNVGYPEFSRTRRLRARSFSLGETVGAA